MYKSNLSFIQDKKGSKYHVICTFQNLHLNGVGLIYVQFIHIRIKIKCITCFLWIVKTWNLDITFDHNLYVHIEFAVKLKG